MYRQGIPTLTASLGEETHCRAVFGKTQGPSANLIFDQQNSLYLVYCHHYFSDLLNGSHLYTKKEP